MEEPNHVYNARVVRVVDGDTVDFDVDLGFNIHTRIRGRLIGVDTPERGHEDWNKATDMCSKFLRSVAKIDGTFPYDETLIVKIKTYKTGKYGRWLVEITGVTDRLAEIWPYKEK